MSNLKPTTPPSTNLLLNARYRDDVSGWEGYCTAIYLYANGCVRACISATDKDGKPEEFIFDEQQLTALDAPVKAVKQTRKAGGPRGNRPVPR